ncbi:MAG: hypothetical protein M3256_19105 [Actinomycetota bacterium]|nr:hypothetical protein [Actinomycetota bacterium]
MLALNGLRISEGTGADIEAMGLQRGHRTLTILRKGGKGSPSRRRPAPPGPSTWPSGRAATGRSSWSKTAAASAGSRNYDREIHRLLKRSRLAA